MQWLQDWANICDHYRRPFFSILPFCLNITQLSSTASQLESSVRINLMGIWKQVQIQHPAEGVAEGNAADLCGSKRRIREQARGGRTSLAFGLVAAASLNQEPADVRPCETLRQNSVTVLEGLQAFCQWAHSHSSPMWGMRTDFSMRIWISCGIPQSRQRYVVKSRKSHIIDPQAKPVKGSSDSRRRLTELQYNDLLSTTRATWREAHRLLSVLRSVRIHSIPISLARLRRQI